METENPGGDGGGCGGRDGGAGSEPSEVRKGALPPLYPGAVDCYGSSNPVAAARNHGLFSAAAAKLARVWKSSPTKSHIYTTTLGGVE